jgi:short-subunit dehydrogenase
MTHDRPPWALITGISKGIGRSLALRFAREGFGLIGCARGQEGLDLLQAEILAERPLAPVRFFRADMSDPAGVRAFSDALLAEELVPEVLIHNAGLFQPGGVLEAEEGQLESLMQTNLFSAYHLTRALVPGMIGRGQGHVFTLCSVASLQAYPGGATYAITKFALLGLTRSLRAETRNTGIKVTALLPGATWSDSWAGVDYPPERLMDPADLAEMVWSAYRLGPASVVEELLIRPQQGDL